MRTLRSRLRWFANVTVFAMLLGCVYIGVKVLLGLPTTDCSEPPPGRWDGVLILVMASLALLGWLAPDTPERHPTQLLTDLRDDFTEDMFR